MPLRPAFAEGEPWPSRVVVPQWVVACGLGAGVAEIIAMNPSVGILLSGGVIAVPQWLVLRRFAATVGFWVPLSATAFPAGLVAGIAAAVGLGVLAQRTAADPSGGFGKLQSAASLLVLLVLVGAILGIAQSMLLVRHIPHALWTWPCASALGATAYFAIRAYAPIALEKPAGLAPAMVLAGALGGAAYGLCTGLVLATGRRF